VPSAEIEYGHFVSHARRDPNVLGVVLAGSRGVGAFITPQSDFDVYIVLAAPSLVDEYAERFPSSHGDAVEYIFASLESFRNYAMPGTPSRWNAYTFAHARPVTDKLAGGIADLIKLKTRPGPGDAAAFLGVVGQFEVNVSSSKSATISPTVQT
jgi:hypothetical protein